MYRTLTCAIAFYFILRLLYFAFVIPHETPPDESTHYQRVIYFNDALLLPNADLPEDQAHLRISNYSPYLYYLIAGKWLSTNIFSIPDLAYIRLLSILFTCFTVFYGWKLISLITENRLVHLLFLIMLTNTLMFSLISASVSYDALTNLFSAMLIYYFAEFTLKRSSASLVYLFLSIVLGTLTKKTILPIAFIVVVCMLIMNRSHLKGLIGNLKPFWSGLSRKPKVWAFVALFVMVLNGFLYGGNMIKFGHFVPEANQILSEEEIYTHPVYARNAIYLDFLSREKDLEESLERAKQIKGKAASLDTMNLLQYSAQQEEFVPMSRLAYAWPWSRIMIRSTYGILGHTITVRSFTALIPYSVIFILALCSVGLHWKQRKTFPVEIALIISIVFYVFLLMQQINYSGYRSFQMVHISVQGRYLFPLIVPIYALIAKYILAVSSTRLQLGVALIISFLFVYGDFIFFLGEW